MDVFEICVAVYLMKQMGFSLVWNPPEQEPEEVLPIIYPRKKKQVPFRIKLTEEQQFNNLELESE